jgi:hypothetical protein
MKNLSAMVTLIGAFISFAHTLVYLPNFLLFPLFPFFGLYAGLKFGNWVPSMWFFGAIIFGAILNSFTRATEGEQ